MNIWNKVFLGIIVVASLTVIVLTSVEMKIRSTGLMQIDKLERRIEETEGKIAKIIAGTAPQKLSPDKSQTDWSFEELRGKTITRFDERGRAWFGCQVRGTNEIALPPALSQVEAQIILTGPLVPNESGLETDVVLPETLGGIVYVFEESSEERAGAFLGRFRVDTVPTPTKFRDKEGNEKNGFQVTLTTADPVSEKEMDQVLDASRSLWSIYMTPPVDRVAGIFDHLTEEEKQSLPEELREPRPMPELTEEEKADVDPMILKIWEGYRKQMDDPESEFGRDTALILNWLYEQRSRLLRDKKVVLADTEEYKTAEEKNISENKKLENDCVHEEKRVAAMVVQRDHVKTLLEQHIAEIDTMTLKVEKLQDLIAWFAAKITEYHVKAVEIIEGQMANE